jgi:cardiolipin synthase
MSNFRWHFYLSTEEAWEAMYRACEDAHSTIDFEQFIFWDEEIGNRFGDLWIKKVKEGVKVRLLCDTAGSYFFSNSKLALKLENAGVLIQFFNPIKPWRITKLKIWLYRDHRKLLIVDNDVAFIGGVGVSEQMRDWRDTQLKITGPIVSELQGAFDHMWWIGERERFARFKEPRQTIDGFSVITNAPHFRQRFIHRTFLEVIRSAKKTIYLTTPYFVPDARFFRVLRLAAKRGVEVRILVPARSNHPYVDLASHHNFAKAFKFGIHIHQYQKGMIHCKTMVIDDDWASVGSSNIDNFSSFLNYEINISSVDKKFVEEMKEQFNNDLKESTEILPEGWKKRLVIYKILEFFFAPLGVFF